MANFDSTITELNNLDYNFDHIQIVNSIKKLIDNGTSIREIDNNCPKLPAYIIINYLIENEGNNINYINAITHYYNGIQINRQRCLVIADTHIGRFSGNENYIKNHIYENERGLFSAYNYALRNGITNIIHLGDLIEGFLDNTQRKIPTCLEQIEQLKKVYPYVNGIKTYLLYGNHDLNLIKRYYADKRFYRVCYNTELIGAYSSYIFFCGNRIKLFHESYKNIINKVPPKIKNIELPYDFILDGHGHRYYIDDTNRIGLMPSLSSSVPDKNTIGFVEMIDEEKEYIFKYFDQNGNEVKSGEKVLLKKKH